MYADHCRAFMHSQGATLLVLLPDEERLQGNRIVKRNAEFQEMFQQVGMAWNMSDHLYHSLQKFTCAMYCSSPRTSDIKELRYRLFCLKRGNADSNQLPPCNDTVHKHSLRANYEAAVWRRSLQRCPDIPLLI